MIIDLHEYKKELEFYIKISERFIDKRSLDAVGRMQADLDQLIDYKGDKERNWETRAPIRTVIAKYYDGHGREKEPVYITLGFYSKMQRIHPKRREWRVCRLETHLKVFSEGDDERPALELHVDKKNSGQLGPHIHLQIAEEYVERSSGMSLAVPRIPIGFLLPTDCLDFALSEFFSEEWGKEQNGAHSIRVVAEKQLKRAQKLASEIQRMWAASPKRTPINLLQNCHFPDLCLT